MKVNLYYAPYPSQRFEDDEHSLSTVRVRNPKSALVTLAAGVARCTREWGLDVELAIVDTQVGGRTRWYKSIDYGPRRLDCYREGGDFEEYVERIRSAEVHGISNNFTNAAGIVTDFARFVKRVRPDALVVAGGMDASARPEHYLERGFDVVVRLEGEQTFSEVLRAHAEGGDLASRLRCARHGAGWIVEPGAPLDMNELEPMRLDLVEDLASYDDTGEGTPPATVQPPFTCFETSRGCYQRCAFCATPMRGAYRFMSPATVERHLRAFRAAGINNVLFQEDNILSRIQRYGSGAPVHPRGRAETIEIFRLARELGFSWEFANGLEFGKFLDDGRLDRELMEALFWNDRRGERWRGCYRVQVPLEFLGEDPRRRFSKLRGFAEQLETLEAMVALGVRYQTFNVIIGHADDDHAAIDGYLRRCEEIKRRLAAVDPDVTCYFNVFNLTLLPGTADFRHRRSELCFDIDRDPEVISVYLSPMNSRHLSYFELLDRRLQLTRELNGDLVDQYDSIRRKPLLAGART